MRRTPPTAASGSPTSGLANAAAPPAATGAPAATAAPDTPSTATAEAQPQTATHLVIDGGKTGCRALLYHHDTAAGAVVHGPGIPGIAEAGGTVDSFAAALAPLAAQLTLPEAPLASVCIGVTGVLEPGPAAELVAGAVHRLIPTRAVLVTSDVVTSYCGAVGLRPGVVTAAGTGTIALAAGDRGVARVDGWGYLLGDAGSGFAIGRRGLDAALRAHDGRDGSAILAAFAKQDFGSLEDIVRAVYGAANPVSTVAAFAERVATAARDGDEVAQSIWREAAAEIAHTTLAAARRAGSDGEPLTMSWTGSLFDAEDLLLEPLLGYLSGLVLPAAPLGSALDGGHHLATAPPGHLLEALVYRSPER